jgi:hypothetical protein
MIADLSGKGWDPNESSRFLPRKNFRGFGWFPGHSSPLLLHPETKDLGIGILRSFPFLSSLLPGGGREDLKGSRNDLSFSGRLPGKDPVNGDFVAEGRTCLSFHTA